MVSVEKNEAKAFTAGKKKPVPQTGGAEVSTTPAPPKPKKARDPYVVIIRNAETDLSVIHAEAIVRYVMPRPDAGHSNSTPHVSVREETLSALVRYDPKNYTSQTPQQIAATAKQRVLFGQPIEYVEHSTLKEGNKQANLARATLTTSINLTALELRKRLAELPGFVSCRKIRSQVFNAVFIDTISLFKSKLLLDEFEAEGVRVKIQLGGHLEDGLREFAQEQGNALQPA